MTVRELAQLRRSCKGGGGSGVDFLYRVVAEQNCLGLPEKPKGIQ